MAGPEGRRTLGGRHRALRSDLVCACVTVADEQIFHNAIGFHVAEMQRVQDSTVKTRCWYNKVLAGVWLIYSVQVTQD